MSNRVGAIHELPLPDNSFEYLLKMNTAINLGRSRGELAENMKSFPIGRYVIFYVVMQSCIQVVRVLHGARDLAPIFEADN